MKKIKVRKYQDWSRSHTRVKPGNDPVLASVVRSRGLDLQIIDQ